MIATGDRRNENVFGAKINVLERITQNESRDTYRLHGDHMTLETVRDRFADKGRTDITIDEAHEVLTDCQHLFMLETVFGRVNGGVRKVLRLLILHQGRWKRVGRTDLFDDVATWEQDPSVDFLSDPLAHMRSLIRYGARYDDERFHVIDSTSDH